MTDRASQSIPIRRSFRLGAWEITLLGLGIWLAIGVFGLFDSVALLAGRENSLAYVMCAVLMMPTLLTFIELRGWIPIGAGSYGLLEALERPSLEFWTNRSANAPGAGRRAAELGRGRNRRPGDPP